MDIRAYIFVLQVILKEKVKELNLHEVSILTSS